MFTASQLVAHAMGDYIFQSQWMADWKAKRSIAALAHVLTYLIPFLLLTHSPLALLLIGGTHFLIDRFRLARYVCWVKNGPLTGRRGLLSWSGWKPLTTTGYQDTVPTWMAVWLFIITDNICHILINGAVLANIK